MILVDTSVWIDHLRRGNARLATLLEAGDVMSHPFVVGELACGSLRNRRSILSLLGDLPRVVSAEHDEVMSLVESRRLMGRGLGYIDVHLLASSLLSHASLWTLDKALSREAGRLGVAASVTAHDRLAHVVGVADSGRAALSTDTGDRLRKILEKGSRARRPR